MYQSIRMNVALLMISIVLLAQPLFAQELNGYKAIKTITKTVIDKSGKVTTFSENEVVVTKESGRTELSLNRVTFLGQPSKFKLIKAYSKTGNNIYPVSPASVRIAPVQNSNIGLTDYMQAIIPMSNLQLGSTVYYSYEVTKGDSDYGYGSDVGAMNNSSLAETEITRFESTEPLRSVLLNNDDLYFTKTEGKIKDKYYVEIAPAKIAYLNEGKEIKSASLFVSTAPSWEYLNKKFFLNYEKVVSAQLPKEFQSIASKAKNKKTSKEIIEFVSREIAKIITYSGDWTTDRKKFFPQNFQTLALSKKGDCKDYSSLMSGILRSIGFKAHPALVLRNPQYAGKEKMDTLSKLPTMDTFNHAIVWARDSSGKEWWIDPTNPEVFADVISSDILGNYALVLDNETKSIKFLPDSNLTAYNITIDQEMEVSADNMVQSNGQVKMSESGYLSFAQVERLMGAEGLNKVMSIFINPRAGLDVNVKKKTNQRIPEYNFSYTTKKLIEEDSKNRKSLNQFNPIEISLKNLVPNQDSYIGELGVIKMTTKVKNTNSPVDFEEDCFVQTPWFSLERYVENKEKDVYVTDIVTTKKRMISKQETLSKEFSYAMSDLRYCLGSQWVTLKQGSYVKSVEDQEIDKQLGPSVYSMTVNDALKLSEIDGPKLRTLASQKLFKYYYLNLQKNPNDVDSLIGISRPIRLMGYISGKDYRDSYVKKAMEYLGRIPDAEPHRSNPKLLKAKFYAFMNSKDLKQANDMVKKMLIVEPKGFDTGLAACELASIQGSSDLAEKWGKSVEPLARTTFEKLRILGILANIYYESSRYSEAIVYYEKIIAAEPGNAWTYHNLALIHQDMKNYDKAIDLELKAVGISPFGVAKTVLSELYLAKANVSSKYSVKGDVSHGIDIGKTMLEIENISMIDDVDPELEKHLIEAAKWNPENQVALHRLSLINYKKFKKNNTDRGSLEKAKSYFDQLAKSGASYPSLTKLQSDIVLALKPTGAPNVVYQVHTTRSPAQETEKSKLIQLQQGATSPVQAKPQK